MKLPLNIQYRVPIQDSIVGDPLTFPATVHKRPLSPEYRGKWRCIYKCAQITRNMFTFIVPHQQAPLPHIFPRKGLSNLFHAPIWGSRDLGMGMPKTLWHRVGGTRMQEARGIKARYRGLGTRLTRHATSFDSPWSRWHKQEHWLLC